MRRLVLYLAIVALAGCATTAPPPRAAGLVKAMKLGAVTEAPCLTFSLPLLHDTSDNPDGVPWNPRALGVRVWHHGGSEWLLANLGNEVTLWNVDDPLHPTMRQDSHWHVPPWGDRDYNLFGLDICDDCRYGWAGYDAQGGVLFDVGQVPAHPSLAVFRYIPEASGVGGVTFAQDGQTYLVAKNLPGGCTGAPTLWRIRGLNPADRDNLQCLTAAGQGIGTDGGYRVSDATGDYLVVADATRKGYVFRIDPGPVLAYTGTWYYAPSVTGHGLAVDAQAGIVASVFDRVRLYSIALGFDQPALLAEWDPDAGQTDSLVAMHYPYLWTSAVAGRIHAFDLSDPAAPLPVDVEFWDPSQPWNSYDFDQPRDAVFAGDGSWLFVARFSVLERFSVDLGPGGCIVPPTPAPEVFADGFESGTAGAWSAVQS